MEPVDLRPTARFPSVVEIAGLVFGLVPFAVSTASMSSHTVNGDTTVHYRDWTAVGGGAAAGVCGVAALALLVRTDPAKRLVRVAAGCALLALAALQILRGFGVLGVSPPATTTSPWERTTIAQEARIEPPAVDVEAPTRQLFAAWREGRIKEIHDGAHPKFRESVPIAVIAEIHESTTESFGKLEKLADKLDTKHEMSTFGVSGKAIYAKTTLDFQVQYQLVDGKPRLTFLHFDLPKDMIDGKPADADRLARQFLDALLAGKVDKSLLEPEIVSKVDAEFDAEVRKLLAKIGTVKSVGEPRATECSTATRCVEVAIVGKKARAVFKAGLGYRITRWRVAEFKLDLAK
jgi:hypothetical protein